ncbi:hypothetical protein E3P92_01700 [Wallemia ichthyophaga]|uniref:Uncharacterized protein n=2 Tax=Wallemia ichthyophaga TaxID=245174 RepID=A0A4T0HLW2_WALIC|nr:uncharacterized protein J056_004545 [Wallemia ichthyophaga EXF-994]TIA83373.1 hypothetical protein E3P98_00918 [Wallemia ichthyophaga]EOR01224.1 hypothetical protein J056_004545 [Wallemia ichthyophaga EXF-994]TIA95048.1 hypothetical protein E3P96_03930 [Wallemia ichthyophaga]TIB06936.1 hypothetical protein E3P93_04123 [Wallemia ichthyophaga]TIB07311.1 hypothetical protein E3P90_04120 [Wallemia ichthyophaga]
MPEHFKKAEQVVDPAGHGMPTKDNLNDKLMSERPAGIAGTTTSTTDAPGPVDDRTQEEKYADSQATAQVNKGGDNVVPTPEQQTDLNNMNERLSK